MGVLEQVEMPQPVKFILNWGRKYSLWVMNFGLACCAIEFIASSTSRHDFIRLGVIPFAPGPRQADLMVVSGTVTDKMAPAVQRLYEQMPEPKYVISFGSCSNSGGPYWDSYCVTKGADLSAAIDFDPHSAALDRIVDSWLPLTFAVNSINRSMGIADLYPFVLAPPVIVKLSFIHDRIHAASRPRVADPGRGALRAVIASLKRGGLRQGRVRAVGHANPKRGAGLDRTGLPVGHQQRLDFLTQRRIVAARLGQIGVTLVVGSLQGRGEQRLDARPAFRGHRCVFIRAADDRATLLRAAIPASPSFPRCRALARILRW